ncbi:hypothetical protein M422DRAFT_263763 [Sphaerobolus stellatus SS14]|uniref:Uncharacterized protein n=1 Tax=Sphaerobolus stellatus (strain SS14) TaxID=990650 RepID=A0A0C9V9F9_SPHS4|nr:hypothetical protein M422DRAFT_263763 [Sphaerobolus stellatus SS14]
MATKRAYEIRLAEVDIGKAVADAWPELGRYQDDCYCLLEDYNALKESFQSVEKKADDRRAKLTELYEKLDSHRAIIKNLGDQVQSLEEQLQETKDNSAELSNHEELEYYQGRVRYTLHRKDVHWAEKNGYCLSDIPASDSEDNDEDPTGLPTIPEEVPQYIPSHPPTKLARPMSKHTKNTGKGVPEAGIPAIGGVLPKPLGKVRAERWDQPALRALDWVMESDVHDSEMCRLYVEGRALQPHEWSPDHTAVIFHINEYVRSLPGLPRNLMACHDNPNWMMNVIQTFNKFDRSTFTYWLGGEARVTPDLARNKLEPYFLWANKIASLKGGIMNQFCVHDDLLPLVRESPIYFPPNVGEPMDQDESDPEPTLSQSTAGSSSLADRLDDGEGGSFSRPLADTCELWARISYFDSLVPQGTACESTVELTEKLYTDNLE